jgi:hypothetical protein
MTPQAKHKHRSVGIYSFSPTFFCKKGQVAGRYQFNRRTGFPADQA